MTKKNKKSFRRFGILIRTKEFILIFGGVASILVCILTLITLFILFSDYCILHEKNTEKDINILFSLEMELKLNNGKSVQFLNNKEEYINGKALFPLRYDTNIINEIIDSPDFFKKILISKSNESQDLWVSLYIIGEAENNINRFLDSADAVMQIFNLAPKQLAYQNSFLTQIAYYNKRIDHEIEVLQNRIPAAINLLREQIKINLNSKYSLRWACRKKE